MACFSMLGCLAFFLPLATCLYWTSRWERVETVRVSKGMDRFDMNAIGFLTRSPPTRAHCEKSPMCICTCVYLLYVINQTLILTGMVRRKDRKVKGLGMFRDVKRTCQVSLTNKNVREASCKSGLFTHTYPFVFSLAFQRYKPCVRIWMHTFIHKQKENEAHQFIRAKIQAHALNASQS